MLKELRRFLLYLTASLMVLPLTAQDVPPPEMPQRKKVAVVFSGGGALGAIHVGFLKVIEEAGLPVDMVVGTSMGSIVGAFYSVGYDSEDIADIFRTTDWTELFLDSENLSHLTLSERDAANTYFYERDFYVRGGIDPQPGGVIRGINVENAFARYLHGFTDSIDFMRDMPRQFACVATDLVEDKEVVLTHGSLVKSIRSSMSIPGVFAPVHMGEMVLVDGGAKNNFAADVARKLGADIVIGVKFDLELGTDKQYRTLMDVLERSAGSDVSRRAAENEKYCDLVIKVPVRGFTSGSFTSKALNSLMERGENATREKLDSIMMLKSLAGVPKDYCRKMHLRDLSNLPSSVDDQHGLIDTREKNTIEASVGARFDTEELAAAQLNGSYFMGGKLNKELSLTLRLGLRSMLRLGFDIEPWKFKKMGIGYEIWYRYQDFYTQGKRTNNLSFLYQRANLKLLSIDALNFDCELGLGWEHYHLFSGLWNEEAEVFFPENEHFFNYHLRLRYDNEDNRYFARRGVKAEAQYEYFTDNLAQWKGHSGFSAVKAMCRVTIPLSPTTHLRPGVQCRFLFGDDIPLLAGNMAGGMSYGKYFPQQLPLVGIGRTDYFASKFMSASLRLQQRLKGRHYMVLDGSMAAHDSSFSNIFDHKPIWGASIAYFYNSSILGPLGASFGWSSYTHRLNFFLTLGYDF